MKKFILLLLLMSTTLLLNAQKPALDYKAYDTWKRLEKEQISCNGEIISYELTVLKGNPILHFYYPKNQKHDSIVRGNNALLASDESFVAWKLSPDYDSIRKLELDKVEQKKWPKDSLFIYHLAQDTLFKFAKLKQVQQAEDAPVLAFLQDFTANKVEKVEPKKIEKFLFWKKPAPSPKVNPYKTEGKRLIVYTSGQKNLPFLDSITQFALSPDGTKIAVVKQRKVKLDSMQVRIYQTANLQLLKEFEAQPLVSDLTWSPNNQMLTFLYSTDTSKTKNLKLLLFNIPQLKTTNFGDSTDFVQTPQGTYQAIASGRKPTFSDDSQLLYFAVSPREKDVKDTLLEREKVNLDIWHYLDLELQPQQLLQKEQELKRGLLYVYHYNLDRLVQLENDTLRVTLDKQTTAPYLLARNADPYRIEAQWKAPSKSDYYRIDLKTAQTTLLGKGLSHSGELAANGRYFSYFVSEGQKWMLLDIEKQQHACMNCKFKDIVWQEDLNGQPMEAGPVGFVGFSKDAKEVYLQSEFDIWRYDIAEQTIQSISDGRATLEKIELRFERNHRDSAFVDLQDGYLIGLRKSNKKESLYYYSNNSLKMAFEIPYRIMSFQKAKLQAQTLIRIMNVSTYPDLWLLPADHNYDSAKRLSWANPQQSSYNWASVETVKWKAYDGQLLEGLLYKPENFDATKKYPLLFYYYELNSDNLHNYQAPKPSASIINPTEYASGGYLVFVPDIRYQPGKPAQGAYNSIMSAADYLIKNFPVDEKRMGLQGQSWGGYQSAMLITMTTRFAAAMAGAPVSNMFSAYGGMRWGSGLNRQFQYESTQSRIGATIWEKPDLYVENSPLFHLPKVQTPLLIMANDRDGAVPWYQGIELYNGMRRLGKPCWLLNYNGDDHNLTKLANKYDLSIRMRQFFDHYLMDAPAPQWMTTGRPATLKDKTLLYE
ncbi:MAG: prolyl oligopeptidase family serine peptidase [Flavobacteriales bacterium]